MIARFSTNPLISRPARGFTLVELLVSIVLVLLLMLGINTVFSMASTTIGAGQAYATIIRDVRSAQAILESDLRGAAGDMPYMIISSQITEAQRHPGELDVMPFRTDLLKLFSVGIYRCQTGNNNGAMTSPYRGRLSTSANYRLMNDVSAGEVWVSYGHLQLYDRIGNQDVETSYKLPGEGTLATNPQNFYANQWVLGRNAMLLRTPYNSAIVMDSDKDYGNDYIISDPNAFSTFRKGAQSTPCTQGTFSIESSRSDLAGTSIANERSKSINYVMANPLDPWWNTLTYRFWARNYFARNPGNIAVERVLSARVAAQMSPCFVAGCSSFMVEYAGDYLSQDTNGNILAAEPDGQIDFVVVSGERQIRWYGMPRDVNGDGVNDVIPLQSVPGVPVHAFERNLTADSYLCAWGPFDRKPRMIRVVYTLEGLQERLPVGQTFEHVVKLP